MTLIIAGTGHRPDKLAPRSVCYSAQVRERLTALARNYLVRVSPDAVISGMALGWDMALALAAIELDIPVTAAVPFKGQELRWNVDDQELYREILSRAALVHIVCPGGYSAAKMQTRNEWMTDNCERIVALWDGTSGGTGNCIRYARSTGVEIDNLWKSWVKYGGYLSQVSR